MNPLRTTLFRSLLPIYKSKVMHTYSIPALTRTYAYLMGDCKKPDMGLTESTVPKENIEIKHTEAKVGDEKIDSFQTLGAISILDHIKGAKNTESGELYALMFTCKKCSTKSIRSFTKQAYHKGVVLIRCEGCQNIHLIADNLGWFDSQPRNLQNLGDGQVQKVHDPIAITKFIKAAFGSEPPQPLQSSSCQNNEHHQNEEHKQEGHGKCGGSGKCGGKCKSKGQNK